MQLARRDLLNINDFTEGVRLHAQKLPKKPENKYISSLSDYQKIIDYLRSIMEYKKSVMPYLIYLMLKTGLRVGEALALTWKEVDFSNKNPNC